MIKRILILALAIGFIAESSVFAADPTPAPSPAKGAVTETASPSPSPAKTHRRQRVEKRVKRIEKREEKHVKERLRLHRQGLQPHRLRSNKSDFFAICPRSRPSKRQAVFSSKNS